MIRISSKYVIIVNGENYTVAVDAQRKDPKKGTPVYVPVGYCSGMDVALMYIAKHMTGDALTTEKEMSLGEAIAIIQKACADLERQIRNALPDYIRREKGE